MSFRLIIIFCLIWALAECSTNNRFAIQDRFLGNNESVFIMFTDFASTYKPYDLGEGKPNFKPPEILSQALADAALGNWTLSQYSRKEGRVHQAISKFFTRFLNYTLNPETEIITTIGATEALYLIILTHTNPGDEWILIQPCFNAYEPMIRAAFATPKFVNLRPIKKNSTISSHDWTFSKEEMAQAFNSKTRGILLNTPNNPSGKIFSRDELEFIADLAKKWNTLVLSDEAYQFMVYDQNQHIRIATLPDMYERTITVGSGGKTFSATGYRFGWAYGDAELIKNLKFMQEFITIHPATPVMESFAVMFEEEDTNFGKPDSYMQIFRREAERKRDHLVKILSGFGMNLTIPEGGYFLLADYTSVAESVDLSEVTEPGNTVDVAFVKWMIKNVGVQAFPISGFYSTRNKEGLSGLLRWTFIKTDEILDGVDERFSKWILQNHTATRSSQ